MIPRPVLAPPSVSPVPARFAHKKDATSPDTVIILGAVIGIGPVSLALDT